MDIPLMYQLILERFWKESRNGQLQKGVAKLVLRRVFRVPRQLSVPLFKEMSDKGYISFNGSKAIVLNVKCNCDVYNM